jgi:hypothetical protein
MPYLLRKIPEFTPKTQLAEIFGLENRRSSPVFDLFFTQTPNFALLDAALGIHHHGKGQSALGISKRSTQF